VAAPLGNPAFGQTSIQQDYCHLIQNDINFYAYDGANVIPKRRLAAALQSASGALQ
jgi:hypothetical protein